ncbi:MULTISPECIES: hypothetical protein [Acutalibacteraceae]|uniref:hypothetical protein n=1 Tax=Acutalibacteraceae TaxID=3082771 RepID=UPI0013E8AB24|nr:MULTISPECIES: hypothetical protein [Acutalibacteraceae]
MGVFIDALRLGGVLFLVIMTIAAFFHVAYLLACLLFNFMSRLVHRLQTKVRHCG